MPLGCILITPPYANARITSGAVCGHRENIPGLDPEDREELRQTASDNANETIGVVGIEASQSEDAYATGEQSAEIEKIMII